MAGQPGGGGGAGGPLVAVGLFCQGCDVFEP